MIERRAWAVVCWLMAAGAAAATNQLSDAEIEGRNIVQHLLAQRPAENFTNTGTLKIRDAKRQRTEIRAELRTFSRNELAHFTSRARHNDDHASHSHGEPAERISARQPFPTGW
jgi:hypothetical protein